MADEVEVIERSAPVEVQLSTSNIIYRGAPGAPGEIGAQGPRGQSAYEIAVENGYVGTPIQWVQSLKGEIGDTGAQGPKGDTPVKGVDYFTAQDISDFTASMSATYATKAEVETAIRGAESGLLKRSVVQTLPVSEIDDNTIYMVPKTGSTGDVYDEYLYVNNVWEHIGSTDVDLTGYATTSYVDNALQGINLKRPLRIITVNTNAVVSSTYDSINMATVYELTITGSKMFPTQEDLEWCNNYLNYGFNEYPFMFQIKYASSSNYVNDQTLLLYPYTGLIRYTDWDNVKDFRGLFQIITNRGSAYIHINYQDWANNTASFATSGASYYLQWVSASSGYGSADISWLTYKWLIDRIAAIPSLPTQPSNNGDYLLKCSVSSGTAAYAWENVVVGGSY